MRHIDQIKSLLARSKNVLEFASALKSAGIPAWCMLEADGAFKRKHGLDVKEKCHRYFVETDATPVNKWENLPQYASVAIRGDLTELKVTGQLRLGT